MVLAGSVGVAWPFAASAQQSALPVIGFLSSYSPNAFGQQVLATFLQDLADAGFAEGRNVAIDARWTEGHYDRLPDMAADLARRQVKVIFVTSTPTALAAKAVTTTIPIVFALSSDPVAIGLVASLARPGGNITGVTRLSVEVGPKRLQLIHALVPTATSVALLVNPANPAIAEPEHRQVATAARALGLELHVLKASDEREIVEAVAKAIELRAGMLIIAPDAFFVTQNSRLAALTLQHRIPAIFTNREFVVAGGLMAYFGSWVDSLNIAARQVGRILKGEKPADLAVQQSTKVELMINLTTAKALGLSVPPLVLTQVDEMIE